MKQLAEGLLQLRGMPPNAINVYLAGDVLIDAATRRAGRRILGQIGSHALAAHALTHVHPDHQGASRLVCESRGVPLWCGAADAPAMEDGDIAARQPSNRVNRLSARLWAGPPRSVDRRLRQGDEVGSFTVIETPGHSAGHVAYWRESDRVLIVGDVFFGCHPLTGIPGLHMPPDFFTPDPARNRRSARELAALEPALVCFGHGPPLRDAAKLQGFVAGLADE